MFTSMDVYDAASSIGHDCQLIIGEYGPEILQNLMPKVVAMLEELEACALYCEKEKDEITRLQEMAEVLRVDCRAQVEQKEKSDKTLEQLEQSWYCETQRLLGQVTSLEEENNRLARQLASEVLSDHSPESPTVEELSRTTVGTVLRDAAAGLVSDVSRKLSLTNKPRLDGSFCDTRDNMISSILSEAEERLQLTEQENRAADLQLIGRLKECASTNFKTIRALNRDILQSCTALDAAEEEVCRLARQSGQLMASRAPHRRQIGQLVAEKAALESHLRGIEWELSELNQKLPPDIDEGFLATTDQTSQNVLKTHDKQLNLESSGVRRRLVLSPTATLPPTVHLSPGQGIESGLLSAKDVTVKDPSAATISSSPDGAVVTLEELRHLLHERNELRCRLIELEEELDILEREASRDPDVEGPLPPEPPDKLRPGWQTPNIKTT
ncbi:RILP-like protein 1 [Paragonimus westermani]|uniref:RILP-like protein 1 n=1 Tax=Paragonimus westermani TaxID=34504 RepID=A0A5J4NUW4_9TREM|nr:RILP-like protein 1 [Paragonimus westermani]